MSLKKHVIVPRSFFVSDVPSGADRVLDRFPHVTRTEIRELARAGIVERLGASGTIWRWTKNIPFDSSRPTEAGRVSLAIPSKLQSFLAAEMTGRPSWCLKLFGHEAAADATS